MAEVGFPLALDLHVHDHQFRLPLQRPDLGHDVGRAALDLGQVDKHLGVAKRRRRQIEARGRGRVEEPEEVGKEGLQHLLEQLIVPDPALWDSSVRHV